MSIINFLETESLILKTRYTCHRIVFYVISIHNYFITNIYIYYSTLLINLYLLKNIFSFGSGESKIE